MDATHKPKAGVALERVTKRYGALAAVDGVDLSIAPGEFFAVLGPSGCGKSTLLRLVAGLEAVDGGTIAIGERLVAGNGRHTPPEARGVAVVFQSYALWPHMSVRQNVAFPTEAQGRDAREAKEVVDRALSAVALDAFEARKPASLSGGQQQRVALARCLASGAGVVLMDEPLANLDPHLRAAMEEELLAVHRASGATTLYITHDQREAMALADRIAVMQSGRFLQVAEPRTLYEEPASADVARFIGRGTLIEVEVERAEGRGAAVRAGGAAFAARCSASQRPGRARLAVRPHHVRLGDGAFRGRVSDATYRGGVFEIVLEADGLPPLAAETREPPGEETLAFAIDDGWVIPQEGDAT